MASPPPVVVVEYVVVLKGGSELEVENSASRVPIQFFFVVTHLTMVMMHGLDERNNIHFSAAATLCQQIAPHFVSQLHGTNLEPLAFALATTIPCWAIPCWAIATESLIPNSSFFPELLRKKKKKNVPQDK